MDEGDSVVVVVELSLEISEPSGNKWRIVEWK